MPLPTGNWKANVNGNERLLTTGVPDQYGLFLGNLAELPMRGFWEEVSQTITFSVKLFDSPDFPTPTLAFFKGYLFRSPVNPAPGQDALATLTGFAMLDIGYAESGIFAARATARRNTFGWFAQIAEVL